MSEYMGDNLAPPFFGPEWPVYPAIDEICQVTGNPDGNGVYPAQLVQFVPPLGFRQRVFVYVYEPNRIGLPFGYYNCRLSGVYGGDSFGVGSSPLFIPTCCRGGSSSGSGR